MQRELSCLNLHQVLGTPPHGSMRCGPRESHQFLLKRGPPAPSSSCSSKKKKKVRENICSPAPSRCRRNYGPPRGRGKGRKEQVKLNEPYPCVQSPGPGTLVPCMHALGADQAPLSATPKSPRGTPYSVPYGVPLVAIAGLRTHVAVSWGTQRWVISNPWVAFDKLRWASLSSWPTTCVARWSGQSRTTDRQGTTTVTIHGRIPADKRSSLRLRGRSPARTRV